MPPDAARSMEAPSSKWIIGPGADIAFFMLPALTGYLCLYVNVGLGVSSFLIWWYWNVAFNGPHFFATLSRTYLDSQEWRERTPLLLGSLTLVLSGPLALAAQAFCLFASREILATPAFLFGAPAGWLQHGSRRARRQPGGRQVVVDRFGRIGRREFRD